MKSPIPGSTILNLLFLNPLTKSSDKGLRSTILPNPSTFADMLFYFWIDGIRLLNPYTRAVPYQGDATYQYYPVALQHSQLLSSGVHNISIVVFSEIAGNLIRQSTLAINSY